MQNALMILTTDLRALPRLKIKPALVELVVVSALMLSYVWVWQGAFNGDGVVIGLLFIGVAIFGHLRRGESLREIGFRTDNLGRSSATVGLIALTLILTLAAAGLVFDTYRKVPIEDPISWMLTLGLFGTMQQYALLGVYFRLFDELLPGSRLVPALTASVFAFFHLPNLPLTVVTLAAGVLACYLYRRVRNLWVLGLSHALISAAFSLSFADLLVVGMKVGIRALA